MSELRVPVVSVPAEALCADGRVFAGRIFLPASAASHLGPTRPEEWMNGPAAFFPFQLDEGGVPVILNKHEVLWLSVPAPAFEAEIADLAGLITRFVQIECGVHTVAGMLLIDMPEHRSRVLDHLNRPEGFLTVWEGERHHLVNKCRITRIADRREE
jgi:hypothetical protein